MNAVVRIDRCRVCGGSLAIPFCDLGCMPLANAYLPAEGAHLPEPVFPLNVRVCERCFLVQLDHVVDATAIFTDYAYFSSMSSSWLAHAAAFVKAAIARHALDRGSFVVEVGSNDGYLLRNFLAAGIACLGVEPAANVAAQAEASGVATRVAFFGTALAEEIVAAHGTADLVIANNVLAHVPDLNDFVAGLARLAGPSGSVSIEAPHVLMLIEQTQFDTIYHEHYAYWSLHAMRRLLATHGLFVYSVEVLTTHGGSLRVLASADPQAGERQGTAQLLATEAREAQAALGTPGAYVGFDGKVRRVIDAFQRYLETSRAGRRRIAGYGAAAKASTFLNACGATASDISVIADRSPAKQGRLLPGSRIPIRDTQALRDERPDDVLILPWNIAGEIADHLRSLDGWNPRLLVAMPQLREVA